MTHAVSLLRSARLARCEPAAIARHALRPARCAGCRLLPSHCLCALRPRVSTRAGFCLLMADVEPLKPSNTGWLVADVVPDTFAFGWARTHTDPALTALLSDPQWQPMLVFPGEYVEPQRVVQAVEPAGPLVRRPLFILLDATWPEARKMFHRSPVLDGLPVLSLAPGLVSAYRLRRSRRDDHFCTSEVAALCLALAGDTLAEQLLDAYLEVFTHHYLQARNHQPVAWDDEAHVRLRSLARGLGPGPAAPGSSGGAAPDGAGAPGGDAQSQRLRRR